MPVSFEYNDRSSPFDDEVDPSSSYQEEDASPGWNCGQWRHESRFLCKAGYGNTTRRDSLCPQILSQKQCTVHRKPYRTGRASDDQAFEISSSPSERVIHLRPEFSKGWVARSRPRSLGPWGNHTRSPYRTALPINVSSNDVTLSQSGEVFTPQRPFFHNDGNLPRMISTISLWSNMSRCPYRVDYATGDAGRSVPLPQCKSVNEMKFSARKHVIQSQFSDQQILLTRRPYRGVFPKIASNIRVSPSDIVAKRLSVLQTRSQSLGRLNRQYRKPYRSGNAFAGPAAGSALFLSDSEANHIRATKSKDEVIKGKARSQVQRIYRFRKPYRPAHGVNDSNKETRRLPSLTSAYSNLFPGQSPFRTRFVLGDAENRISPSICNTTAKKVQLDLFESSRQTWSQSLGLRNRIPRHPYRTVPDMKNRLNVVTGCSSETVVKRLCTDGYRNVPPGSGLQSSASEYFGDADTSYTSDAFGLETQSTLNGVRESIDEADKNFTSDDSIIGITSCPSDSEEEDSSVVFENSDLPRGSLSLQPVISSPPGEAIEDSQSAALRIGDTTNSLLPDLIGERSLEVQPWRQHSCRPRPIALSFEWFTERAVLTLTDAEAALVRSTTYRDLLSWWYGLTLANNLPQTLIQVRGNGHLLNSQQDKKQQFYLRNLAPHSPAILAAGDSTHSCKEMSPLRGIDDFQLFLQFLGNITLLCSPLH